MSIASHSLIGDSFNFFKNQLSDLCILSFISATISLILYYFLISFDERLTIIKILGSQNNSTTILTLINQLSDEEKAIMIRVLLLSFIVVFIGLILLVSSVTTYLSELSIGNKVNALQAFILSLRILPSMLLLLFICTIIIYFSFMLFILPGVIVAIGFSLSPIILITTKNVMLLQVISQSWKIAFRHWWLILSILSMWLVFQMLITTLLGHFRYLPSMINNIISFTLNNLLTSFTLIYFFRLYMLVVKY
ncbi:MAG: YciC family protein [Candidatus Arsenophonus melophagi]|nr:YciC family protein [Candidatus Arsenophonus melophagi]